MGFLRSSLGTGIIVGAAVGMAGREVLPAVGSVLRPVVRTTLKLGVVGYEKVRQAFANVGESFEDVAAEVRSEVSSEGASAPLMAASGTPEAGAQGEEPKRRNRRENKEEGTESRQAS